MDLFSSEASLIIPFQIQPDRILQFSPVQNFHDLLGFALYLCNCHSIGILICPNRDIVFPAFREVLLKVAIYHVSRFTIQKVLGSHWFGLYGTGRSAAAGSPHATGFTHECYLLYEIVIACPPGNHSRKQADGCWRFWVKAAW